MPWPYCRGIFNLTNPLFCGSNLSRMTNPIAYNGQRAKTIVIIMGVLLVVQTALMASNYWQMGLLVAFSQGNIDIALAEAHELRHGL
jgi:hypothetical protein